MAEEDIIQSMIVQPGQSQADRVAPALDVHYADVDERASGDFLAFTQALAPSVSFFEAGAPFSPGEFVNLAAFAAAIKAGADPVSSYVKNHLPTAAADLASWDGVSALSAGLSAELLVDINAIVAGRASIYDPVRFAGVTFRTQTAKLLTSTQGPLVTSLLNRLLLGDAYPDDIAPGTWASALGVANLTSNQLEQLLASSGGNLPAHLALFLSFLQLYQQPQGVINQITGRHLDFYYRQVLQLPAKPAVPDTVNVLVTLKNQASPISIGPANVFSGGKDATGVELIYAPVGTTIINLSSVASLRSVFVDTANPGTVLCAPVANSSDGVGGKLNPANPAWHGFGGASLKLPAAQMGFAIASPVLLMQEGTRTVTLSLAISGVKSTVTTASLGGMFTAYITGVKGWLGSYGVTATLSGGVLTLVFVVPATDAAVVGYNPTLHGDSYGAKAPLIKVFLNTNPGAGVGYNELAGVILNKAQVSVNVQGVKTLDLESDAGTLDPTKAFLPFGSQPAVGSQFMVGCPEALSKKLTSLDVTVTWKGAPPNLPVYYTGYTSPPASNASFTAAATFIDGSGKNYSESVPLFSTPATTPADFSLVSSPSPFSSLISEGMKVFALSTAGPSWARVAAEELVLRSPILGYFLPPQPQASAGFITFTLKSDFLYVAYRKEYVTNLMEFSKGPATDASGNAIVPVVLNEPYTPVVQSLSLDYNATSDNVTVTSPGGGGSLVDFANPDIQFFQIGAFGEMREHGYQRNNFTWVTQKKVALLYPYGDTGDMLVGFAGLNPGDSVCTLFQVAEGSANPDLQQAAVTWSVLCDNYWMPLGDGVVGDTTNQLLTSGVITFVIPTNATTNNTILPSGFIWLCAGVSGDVSAVCQLIDVEANAVQAQFADNGNDPNHLAAALPAGTVSKLKTSISAVKTVAQPYASFGGSMAEVDAAYYTRVSERLRHKDRCVTPWDYERVILEAFPSIYRAKCIPHSSPASWFAPGSVLIVVVPDLRNMNAVNPLEPKADLNTITDIEAWVRARAWAQNCGPPDRINVKNPNYQKIQVDFKVRFLDGYEYNFYSNQLNQQIIQFLSPWAYEPGTPITFGGTIYKSVILDFVQDIGYVDFVTDFKMYCYSGDTNNSTDLDEAQPQAPDAILVSADSHTLAPVPGP